MSYAIIGFGNIGVRSRLGSSCTLAASHHQRNQTVESSLTRDTLSRNSAARDGKKSATCLRLAYVRILLFRAPPLAHADLIWSRFHFRARSRKKCRLQSVYGARIMTASRALTP
jgi:hypothetical protein